MRFGGCVRFFIVFENYNFLVLVCCRVQIILIFKNNSFLVWCIFVFKNCKLLFLWCRCWFCLWCLVVCFWCGVLGVLWLYFCALWAVLWSGNVFILLFISCILGHFLAFWWVQKVGASVGIVDGLRTDGNGKRCIPKKDSFLKS